jgi:hypothetical protein
MYEGTGPHWGGLSTGVDSMQRQRYRVTMLLAFLKCFRVGRFRAEPVGLRLTVLKFPSLQSAVSGPGSGSAISLACGGPRPVAGLQCVGTSGRRVHGHWTRTPQPCPTVQDATPARLRRPKKRSRPVRGRGGARPVTAPSWRGRRRGGEGQ